jgi:hypothetical protein
MVVMFVEKEKKRDVEGGIYKRLRKSSFEGQGSLSTCPAQCLLKDTTSPQGTL